MKLKKSPRADLRRYRSWFLLGSLLMVTAIFVALLQVRFFFTPQETSEDDMELIVEDLSLTLPPEDDYVPVHEKIEEPPILEEIRTVETAELPQQSTETGFTEEVKQALDALNDLSPEENPLPPEPVLTVEEVDEIPQYRGGMKAFVQFLTRQLRYPPSALLEKKEGKLMATFIVNEDGRVSDLQIDADAYPAFAKEAQRVLKIMGEWKPGKKHGQPCKTLMAIPIVFKQ